MWKTEPSHTAGGCVKRCSHFEKSQLQKTKYYIYFNLYEMFTIAKPLDTKYNGKVKGNGK